MLRVVSALLLFVLCSSSLASTPYLDRLHPMVKKALEKEGITTDRQLLNLTRYDLELIPHVGADSIQQIENFLEARGEVLRDNNFERVARNEIRFTHKTHVSQLPFLQSEMSRLGIKYIGKLIEKLEDGTLESELDAQTTGVTSLKAPRRRQLSALIRIAHKAKLAVEGKLTLEQTQRLSATHLQTSVMVRLRPEFTFVDDLQGQTIAEIRHSSTLRVAESEDLRDFLESFNIKLYTDEVERSRGYFEGSTPLYLIEGLSTIALVEMEGRGIRTVSDFLNATGLPKYVLEAHARLESLWPTRPKRSCTVF